LLIVVAQNLVPASASRVAGVAGDFPRVRLELAITVVGELLIHSPLLGAAAAEQHWTEQD
jgi:hypothetical protein